MNESKIEKQLKTIIVLLIIQLVALALLFIAVENVRDSIVLSKTYTTIGDIISCNDYKDKDMKKICLDMAREGTLVITGNR